MNRLLLTLWVSVLAGCSFDQSEGKELYAEKKYKEAIPVLLEQLKKDSLDTEVLMHLAEAYRLSGDYGKAVVYFEKCARQQPDNFELLLNMGDSYYKIGDTLLAETTFKKAMMVRPESPELLYNLGVLYFNKNDFSAATQYLASSLEKKESPEGYWLLSKALLNSDAVDPALDAITIAISLDSTVSSYYVTKGIIHGKKSKLQASSKDFNRALELDSLNREAYYNRAYAYHLIGKQELACNDILKAIKLGLAVEESVRLEVCGH